MNNYLRHKIITANMRNNGQPSMPYEHRQPGMMPPKGHDSRDMAFDPYTGTDRGYDSAYDRNYTLAGREIRGQYNDQRDYAYDRQDRAYDRRDMTYDRTYDRRDMNYNGGDYNYDNRDMNYDRRDMQYNDYNSHKEFEYNYDMHDMPLEIHKKDIKRWEQQLENADGSHGMKFSKEQIIPMAQKKGIKFDKFNEDEFTMAVNMLYSDYCEALKESMLPNYQSPEPYINMAKAFFHDKDFKGQPYEKLALYYHGIVNYN